MIRFRNLEDETYYREVEEFAKKTGQLRQFRGQLWILHTFGERGDPRFENQLHLDPAKCSGTLWSRAWLYRDFAPYSFNVALERRVEKAGVSSSADNYEPWMSMALIYHGEHDKYGSGLAPTLAVTAGPVQGWSIHS